MIARDSVTEVGQIFKPHGVKGEMTVELDYDLKPSDVRCFLVEKDGILVPFFVAESRKHGHDSWLIRFDGVNDEIQAGDFNNALLFAMTDELPEHIRESESEGVHLYDLIGFTLFDAANKVGIITSIDDNTANVVFTVETEDGKTVLVPFAEELISDLDAESRTITLDLPSGILELN